MEMIYLISDKFKQNNIYYKLDNNFIVTRKSKVLIPKINEDIAYLTGVIAGDGTLIKTKRKRGGNHYVLRIYANSTDFLKQLNELFKLNFKNLGEL